MVFSHECDMNLRPAIKHKKIQYTYLLIITDTHYIHQSRYLNITVYADISFCMAIRYEHLSKKKN